jgi:hypothetical protein
MLVSEPELTSNESFVCSIVFARYLGWDRRNNITIYCITSKAVQKVWISDRDVEPRMTPKIHTVCTDIITPYIYMLFRVSGRGQPKAHIHCYFLT